MVPETEQPRARLSRRQRSYYGRHDRRTALLRQAQPLLFDHPLGELSLVEIARRTGVSLWAWRYHFHSLDNLFRASVTDLIDGIESTLRRDLLSRGTVLESIQDYALFLRKLVRSPPYQDLMRLVLGYGRQHEWLRDAYDRRVAAAAADGLSTLVLKMGERLGTPVLFKKGALQRFHRRIETEFGLRDILSAYGPADSEERDAILKDIVREAFAATYSFDWQSSRAA